MTKVLLVEDDDEIAQLIELYCLQENFDCKRANNGIAALQLFERHLPQVIILDLMLPGLDGLPTHSQFTRWQRSFYLDADSTERGD